MGRRKKRARSEDRDAGNELDDKQEASEDSKERDQGLKLDTWQEEILEHDGHFLLCTGRQVGKTTVMAIKAAEYMVKHKGSRIIVVSLTEDQAELIIVMALNHLETNYQSWIKRPYSTNITKKKIILNNKSQILARPVGTTGDAVRGFTGNILIIDEASKMPESVFTAAKPTLLTTGGKIWMCSTPFGKKGYFWECFDKGWNKKRGRYKVFRISSEEVVYNRPISSVWTEEVRREAIRDIEEEKEDMTTLQYGQEFLGLFMEDIQQFFSDELIKRSLTLSRSNRVHHFSPDYFLGVDIARLGPDLSSFEVIQKINKDMFYHVHNETTSRKYTTETFDKICDLDKQWNFIKVGIDAGSGSLGVGILDFLLRVPILRRKIIALNNREVELDSRGEKTGRLVKEAMYIHMQMLMEQGKIRFLDDDDVRLSLKSIQYEYVIKDGQPTKMKIYGSGSKKIDHIVEGLVRAVYLANQKHLIMKIDSI